MKEVYRSEFNWWQKVLAKLLGMWRINRDSIDFKWGYFSPRFGLEMVIDRGHYFDARWGVHICILWGCFYIQTPFRTGLEESHDWAQYGFRIYSGSELWILLGGTEKNQHTRRDIHYQLPFFSWVFDYHQHKGGDGSWLPGGYENRDTAHTETHPYTYRLRSGEIQKRQATCIVERRQWHRKWLPFWKMVRTNIWVEFDGEVGEESGSWKGGVMGCGWGLLEGETVEQCLRRMESTRKM